MGLLLTGVSKSFRSFQAIKDLSLEIWEGTLFGILGANGAGKTTTMRMILDLFRPDSGQITWNGRDVRQVPRRSFGYLPEERGLYPKMRVDEQLLFLARLNGLSKQGAEKELEFPRIWRVGEEKYARLKRGGFYGQISTDLHKRIQAASSNTF